MDGRSGSAVFSPRTFRLRDTDLPISKLLFRPAPLKIDTLCPPESLFLCRDTSISLIFNKRRVVERPVGRISIGEQVGFAYFGVGSD